MGKNLDSNMFRQEKGGFKENHIIACPVDFSNILVVKNEHADSNF